MMQKGYAERTFERTKEGTTRCEHRRYGRTQGSGEIKRGILVIDGSLKEARLALFARGVPGFGVLPVKLNSQSHHPRVTCARRHIEL
jgi:hypothetical protein